MFKARFSGRNFLNPWRELPDETCKVAMDGLIIIFRFTNLCGEKLDR